MTTQRKDEMPQDETAALEALEWLEEHCWVDEPAEEVARSMFKLIRADVAPTSQWRDISSAPKDGTQILLYQPQFDTITTGNWMKEDSSICPNEWFPLSEATHWQPLPAPPTKALAAAEEAQPCRQ